MTPNETLESLVSFIEQRPPLGVAVVGGNPDAEIDVGEPRTLSLAGDAEEYFYGVINEAVVKPVKRKRWKLVELDPIYKPDSHEVEHKPVQDVPAVAMAVDHYSNLGPFSEFTGENEFVERLRFYVAVLGAPGDDQAFFFRRFTASSELERKRGAALMRHGAQFGKVEEKIFIFDEAVDCVVFRDGLFVLRKTDYRWIFDQFEELETKAGLAADALNEKVPIANFVAFRAACSRQRNMADKLVAIQGRDYFAELSVEKLESVIAEFSIDLTIQGAGGQRQLVFQPDVEHRWLILKLLDDDYLRSTMTKHLYEANSKLPR